MLSLSLTRAVLDESLTKVVWIPLRILRKRSTIASGIEYIYIGVHGYALNEPKICFIVRMIFLIYFVNDHYFGMSGKEK